MIIKEKSVQLEVVSNRGKMRHKKIGEILVDKGVLKPDELEEALRMQSREKVSIGKILIGQNYIRSRDLHEALAERFGLDFIDLTISPPNMNLLKHEQAREYFELELVPFSEDTNSITLAATGISDDLNEWALKQYPDKEIRFVITSPYDIRHVLQKKFADYHDEIARLNLLKENPRYSAHKLFDGFKANIYAIGFISVFILTLFYEPGFIALVAAMNFLFFTCISFKNFVFLLGQKPTRKIKPLNEDENLPVYTILLPLYHEDKTLPKLIKAIDGLDYPKSKLDVKFVVEADDVETISAIKKQQPPQYMEIITVPYSLPRTKPKACNYAINFARGEYVTIYDAEDLPDPAQLKTVLAKFARGGKRLACVQARLNYFNYSDNQLTRWFALEYATWFDSVMKGLEYARMPIPLGGTSNHVKTSILKEIGGWDAFNVTEDADLGMRLAQEGWRTETINSLTLEEAPNRLMPWIKQRTRWLKGFMQTYFVHMRDILKLTRNIGIYGFLSLQFFIGIPVLIYLTTPLLVTASVLLTSGTNPAVTFPDWLNYYCWFNLVYGSISHMVMCLIAVSKARKPNGEEMFKNPLVYSSLTFPLYSFLHVIAAFRALYQLLTDPHYWDKTQHGLAKTGI